MKKKVSILVPCYNEEASLPLLYNALSDVISANTKYDYEILFINDGSKDNTLKCLKNIRNLDQRVNYIDLSRNFGKENAMLAGFDYVTGDCMIIMDADLQHPPSVIAEMLKYWELGYDDVYAKRKTRGKESFLRKKLSLMFYKILQYSSRFDILQNVGDFRLLDRSCINALKQLRETERYTKGMFCWIGFKKYAIEFEQGDRIAGNSSMSYKNLISLAIEGIMSFTTAPLRFATIMGATVSLFAFIYMIYICIKTIICGEAVQGFPTLIIVILFLGGVQLLSLGIIGEYIGRIFKETRQRPPYLVREYNGNKL